MRKIICDKCGQPMDGSIGLADIEIPAEAGKHLGRVQIRLTTATDKDVCRDCVFDAIATYADRKPRAVA